MKQLLDPGLLVGTNADIAHEGAHLAHKLAATLDWKYRIHTRSQSPKSQQLEKTEEADAEGEPQPEQEESEQD